MNRYQLNVHERILLFIQIYQELCRETIQFDRSMARPLILNACYFKSNKWKVCVLTVFYLSIYISYT